MQQSKSAKHFHLLVAIAVAVEQIVVSQFALGVLILLAGSLLHRRVRTNPQRLRWNSVYSLMTQLTTVRTWTMGT